MEAIFPIHKLNNGIRATLCNHCRTVISTDHTSELFCSFQHEYEFNTIREEATRIYPSTGGDDEYYCDLGPEYLQPAFVDGVYWQQERTKEISMEVISTFVNWVNNNFIPNNSLTNSVHIYQSNKDQTVYTLEELLELFKTH